MEEKNKELIFKLGQKIRILRTKQGLSQDDLSEKSKVSLQTIGRIERGENDTKISNICAIANALDVDISELFIFTF